MPPKKGKKSKKASPVKSAKRLAMELGFIPSTLGAAIRVLPLGEFKSTFSGLSVKPKPSLMLSQSDDDIEEVKVDTSIAFPQKMFLRSLMGMQILQLTTTTEFKVATTAGGAVNSVFNVSGITGSTEWGSINQLFDEFFVISMELKYFPISRYQYLMTSPPTTDNTNVPFASVSLYHNNVAYSASLAGPAENETCRFGNTMENHTHTWVNNENWRSAVNVSSTTSVATSTQGWCNIAASPAGAYAGFVQFCGSDFMHASSFQFGRVVAFYKALYRNRS